MLFSNTVAGTPKARVILRAVNLTELAKLLEQGPPARRQLEQLARRSVFGPTAA